MIDFSVNVSVSSKLWQVYLVQRKIWSHSSQWVHGMQYPWFEFPFSAMNFATAKATFKGFFFCLHGKCRMIFLYFDNKNIVIAVLMASSSCDLTWREPGAECIFVQTSEMIFQMWWESWLWHVVPLNFFQLYYTNLFRRPVLQYFILIQKNPVRQFCFPK